MRFLFAFLLPVFIFFAVLPAHSAETVYRIAHMRAGYPWHEGLIVNFDANEPLCKKYYGSRWQAKCAAPLGRTGSIAKGVRLYPPADGQWQWREPNALVFLPANGTSLKPATTYKADLSTLGLPAFVSLNTVQPQCQTLPQAAQLIETHFWTDPSPQGVHRLAMSLDFAYPVSEKNFQYTVDVPAGAHIGKPELVWNQGRDHLNISWPVRKLPHATAPAQFQIKNIRQISMYEGYPQLAPVSAGANFAQNLPSAAEIFNVKAIKLVPETNAGLDLRYILDIETSLQAKAGDVRKLLEIRQLPEFNSPGALKPYNWTTAPAYPASVISKSEILTPVPLQKDDISRCHFRFEVPATSGRFLMIRLDNKLQSISGQKLLRNWHGIIEAKPLAAHVGFLQPGHILSGSGLLDIYGIELDVIEWDVQLIRDPFLALLAQGSDNAFSDPLENTGIDIDALSERASGKIRLPAAEQGKARYAVIDLRKAIAGISRVPFQDSTPSSSGIVMVRLKGFANGEQKATASRVIAAANLSILLKRASNGSLDCFVHNNITASPAGGANIQILGANGKPVATAVADASGHALIPSLAGLAREARPVAAIARKNGELAWLPLEDRSRSIDFTNFDVGGSHVNSDDILIFAFGERGIYRPGDTLRFGCMPRKADFSLVPSNLPLYAEILDPRGIRIWEKTFAAGTDGIAELCWTSPETSLSGRYALNVKNGRNGNILGSTIAKIESFQPDTLKIKVEPPAVKGWLVASPDTHTANVFLQNLYGTPAEGHKIRTTVNTQPARFCFAGYESWTFSDPAPFMGNGVVRTLPAVETDKDGKAVISMPADLFGSASAWITIMAEGFDKAGGRATGDSAVFLASPMRQILGYRLTSDLTNLDFIQQGENAPVAFMSIDASLNPSAWKNLRFSIMRRNFITNLVSDGQGGFRYDEIPQELTLRQWQADVPETGISFNLDTGQPGDFLLAVHDAAGHTLAQIPYNVVGDRLADAASQLAGSKMRMRIDKKNYNAGEEIQIAFSLPYDASGIISLERENVRAWQWVKAHAGDNMAKIKIPADFEGRGHIVAAFMRSQDSDAIYTDPLAFAAIPFNSNLAARRMNIKLEGPKIACPGKDIEIMVSSTTPGRAAIFAVDEGILQLTAFATPNPLQTFLADRALDVSTLQTANLQMPEHGSLARRLAAFGGGAEISPFGARFQNPFKRRTEPPVAFWAGIVDIGQQPVGIKIPVQEWYNGKVRIMAVGSGTGVAGSNSMSVSVRAPLVITPALPLAVAPGDIFEGTLILANTTGQLMRINPEISANAALRIEKALPAEIELAAGAEVCLPFRMQANALPGATTVSFVCKTSKAQYQRSVSLSVRPASALRTTVQTGMINGAIELPLTRPVYAEEARSSVTVSGIPLPLAGSLANYLETYPYGCTEQLISRAFAQIALAKYPKPGQDEQAVQKLLETVQNVIAARFQEGMGVALWDGGQPDLFLTAYAADYLLSLREAGLNAPAELLARLCDALRWNCALNEPTLAAARASAYAIWVLAREGNVVTQLIEELMNAVDERGVAGFRNDVGYVLVIAAMREMHMPGQMDLTNFSLNGHGWLDEYAQSSLAMFIMARYFPDNLTEKAKDDFFAASVLTLNNNNFSTFSASQGARALVALSGNAAPELAQTNIKCLDDAVDVEMNMSADGTFLTANTPRCSRYKLVTPSGQQLFWQITTTGFDRATEPNAVAHGIELDFALQDNEGRQIMKMRQGDEALMRITARAEQEKIEDCVISSLLPGGLEMIVPRKGSETWPDGVKYIDRQEDRMLIFTDLNNMPQEFVYRVRAVTPGQYLVPGISAEAMYNRSLYGATAVGKMEIERQ